MVAVGRMRLGSQCGTLLTVGMEETKEQCQIQPRDHRPRYL